jgi:hypothetical protein
MAELERGPGARRAALGDAARLAAGLGDTERAAGAWRKRLSLDPTDREALDALVDLAAARAKPELLVEALRARAGSGVTEAQRRADLVRIAAELLGGRAAGSGRRGRDLAADRGPLRGRSRHGGRRWRRLLGAAEPGGELVERLSRAGEADRARLAELCEFLGAVCLRHADDPQGAATWFSRSLHADPGHEPARAGLRALPFPRGQDPGRGGGGAGARLRRDRRLGRPARGVRGPTGRGRRSGGAGRACAPKRWRSPSTG